MNHPPLFTRQTSGATSISSTVLSSPPASTNTIDIGSVEQLRHQPRPQSLELQTTSPAFLNVRQMVEYVGSYSTTSITNIFTVISYIHNTLNAKTIPDIRAWVRLLSNNQLVDRQMGVLQYFNTPYAELMGLNTISFTADVNAVDLIYWNDRPNTVNTNKWSVRVFDAPQSIKETIRVKLSSSVVNLISTASKSTNTKFKHSVTFDALYTTAGGSGDNVIQERPIGHKVAHGVSLNSDWYHQTYRILDHDRIKQYSRDYTIAKLDGSGFMVHKLVNILEPVTVNINSNMVYNTNFANEGTFPNRQLSTISVNHVGGIEYPRSTVVNKRVITPVKA